MKCMSCCFVASSVSMANEPIRWHETSSSAASGHGKNQLIVVPDIKAGNFLALVRNRSPTGDMHSTKCSLARTLFTKYLHSQSPVSWKSRPHSFFATARISFTTLSFSSVEYKPGISPDDRNPLMYSRNDSDLISLSVNKKQTSPRVPAKVYWSRMSSKSWLVEYDFVIVTWNILCPWMDAASRVRDCLPEPPTPTRRMFPRFVDRTRMMRETCLIAASNSTRESFLVLFSPASLYPAILADSLFLSSVMFSTGS
eukprot:gene19136-biopygen19402